MNSEWLTAAYTDAPELTFGQIGTIIDDTSRLFFEDQFDQVNQELKDADPSKMCVIAVVAVVRSTYPARDRLPERDAFVERARESFKQRDVTINLN